MNTPLGTKRTIGFVLMVLPFILPFFGYELSDVAIGEITNLSDPLVGLIGSVTLIYGTLVAKGPHWIVKKD